MELIIDEERYGQYETGTGVFVRAKRESGEWLSVDILEITKASLKEWLRSRGGKNVWAENVVGVLLGHGNLWEGK